MWNKERAARRTQSLGQADGQAAWRSLAQAFAAIIGFPRLLFYDLPPESAPSRLTRSGISLRGSLRWRSYLDQRRRFDDGDLALVVALRQLGAEERLLAVNWGTAHANTFLLIEPGDSTFDLTSRSDPESRAIWWQMDRVAGGGNSAGLERQLRGSYGSWVYWPSAPATVEGCSRLALPLDRGSATLFERLQAALAERFPPSAFHEHLSRLLKEESELFIGRSVERARSPFLTRLGLPAFYEPSLVTGALRRMVNDGQASVVVAGGTGTFRGPDAPVPDDVPNELFERMLL